MAIDKEMRGKLARAVTRCRVLLEEEFSGQLQAVYGVQPDGNATPLQALTSLGDEEHVTARVLRDMVDHLSTRGGKERAEAVRRVVREQAFTVLNRFVALRLAEPRGFVGECVRRGFESEGFRIYLTHSGGSMGTTYDRYRTFLLSVFDEISLDLGVLFDRHSPQGLLFPGEKALASLLVELDQEELAPLWEEDETLGWVYQYFNPPEERKAMRKAAGAPRDWRELAVRNQFFTPRYVVRFLADNTLGRTWYEMTQGRTALAADCELLVRKPGEKIPERPLRDPREIRLLDPACGSMHFGLYAFDLFETIYREAWDDHPELLADMRKSGIARERFLAQVPGLIIRNNLHGIDIDRRAVQISGLSLWLRAQKSYARLGLKAAQRPPIRRSNIVCAEPMPGEEGFLAEFVRGLTPAVLGQVVRTVWEEMRLAGEAGSLLKVEETAEQVIRRAHAAWQSFSGELFPEESARADRARLGFDFTDIRDAAEWEGMEARVLEALAAFAEQALERRGFQRRLFAEDAAAGFAFIDVLRRRYDVVLMNPPFGESARGAKAYIQEHYPRTKNDLFAAFVESFLHRLVPKGMLGAITSRTGFFLSSFQKWREEVLLKEARPTAFADLGFGVLDAMVETAAYCLERVG